MKEFKEYEEFKEWKLFGRMSADSAGRARRMNPSIPFDKILQPVLLAGCRKGRTQSNPTPK
jgi:hypothetical protein